ncbi:hypothetical protein SDC9_176507 [bioreactor metagenome]|uniref:Uncharacterized protein n=1 Tax=bioreactor metagenome TaxID=1076179 RepID=A0A645GTC4_9ZZZZ
MSLLVTSSPLSSIAVSVESPAYSSAKKRPKRTTPVALETVSKQPRFPHVHSKPFGSTVIWPISPPAPAAPCTRLPAATIPPPTPVPNVTKTTSGSFSPAPFQRSPRAATLASLSTANLIPVPAWICSLTGCSSVQFKLYAPITVPASLSTLPGVPIPIPIKSSTFMLYKFKR